MLRFVGEVVSNDLAVGGLTSTPLGESVVFDLALDTDAGMEAPWGPVTMIFPVVPADSELRVGTGESVVALTPPESEQGHTLLITSGVTPDGADTDVFDLPRIFVETGVYSMRLFASDSDSNSFSSADPMLLPSSSDAGTFEDSAEDVMIWRVDGQSDDPRVRPGTMHIRLLEYQTPIVCTGDIADDFGTIGNSDGAVTFGDFLALLSLVGPCPGGTPGCTGDLADTFANPVPDGTVDFGDFLFMLSQANAICQ